MILSQSISVGIGRRLTKFQYSYDPDPPQEYLINAISISRSWSIQHLFGYALDHFRRKFVQGQIHPAVVLGIAREHGIPELIGPAVKALAKPSIPLASWCTDPEVLRHVTLEDVAKISRMKEKLLTARIALSKVPPVAHDPVSCLHSRHDMCSALWRQFWLCDIVPRLLESSDEVGSQLVWIASEFVVTAKVEGMTKACLTHTIQKVGANAGWKAEVRIPEGAIESLMVPERMMLAPDSE